MVPAAGGLGWLTLRKESFQVHAPKPRGLKQTATADKGRGFAGRDPEGVWERSAETRGSSFCHMLFLAHCGTRPGRGSCTRCSAGRQAGGLQIRTFNRKLGSRSADAPHRKQTKQPNPASQVLHKLPVRKGGWGCRGEWGAAGTTSDPHSRFWFAHCRGSARCWHPSAHLGTGERLYFLGSEGPLSSGKGYICRRVSNGSMPLLLAKL